MTLPPRLRKLALTSHVVCSVGWLGVAVAFIALTVVGLTSPDTQTVRGAYLVMAPAARLVLLPLAFAAPLTGLLLSLGTTWGLVRHYWVLVKVAINVFSTLVLLTYMETFRSMAAMAADPGADLGAVRSQSPLMHGLIAVGLLLVATAMSVYKPRGMTRYGQRRQHEQGARRRALRVAPARRAA